MLETIFFKLMPSTLPAYILTDEIPKKKSKKKVIAVDYKEYKAVNTYKPNSITGFKRLVKILSVGDYIETNINSTGTQAPKEELEGEIFKINDTEFRIKGHYKNFPKNMIKNWVCYFKCKHPEAYIKILKKAMPEISKGLQITFIGENNKKETIGSL